jgi:hypothetical protein
VLVDHRTGRRRRGYGPASGAPRAVDRSRILPLEPRARRSDPRDEGPKVAG